MKKLILLVLIALGAWQTYSSQSTVAISELTKEVNIITDKLLDSQAAHTLVKMKATAQSQTYFFCDGRQSCSQMESAQEAQFFLENCPAVQMDIDFNGIACERDFVHFNTSNL